MLHLRTASIQDSPILTALHAEGFANYWDTNAFNNFFAASGTVALIVEEDGQPVGMLVYRSVHEQADIITVAVRPSHRGRGIAKLLMRRAMDEAKALGATQMFLDVEDGNAAASQLYAGLGFTQINRRKLYYRQKDGSYTDALVMTCKL